MAKYTVSSLLFTSDLYDVGAGPNVTSPYTRADHAEPPILASETDFKSVLTKTRIGSFFRVSHFGELGLNRNRIVAAPVHAVTRILFSSMSLRYL